MRWGIPLLALLLVAAIAGTVALIAQRRHDDVPPIVSLSIKVNGDVQTQLPIMVRSGSQITPTLSVSDNNDASPSVTIALNRDVQIGPPTDSEPQTIAPEKPFVLTTPGTYSLIAQASDAAGNKSTAQVQINVLAGQFQEAVVVIEESNLTKSHDGISELDVVVLLASRHDLRELSKFHLALQLLDAKGAMMTAHINDESAEYVSEGYWRIRFRKTFAPPLGDSPVRYRVASFVGEGQDRWQLFVDTSGIEADPTPIETLRLLKQ